MPRSKRPRKIVAPPDFKGYKPYGTHKENNGYIELMYEEYEAIKLADHDLLNHDKAAELMDVSRPTFARIYESARRKIAQAMVEVKEIRAVYGNAFLENDWYVCQDCDARFTIPVNINKSVCAVCNGSHIKQIIN